MKAVVMGSGGWGTALSQVLCDNGHDTWLWSHNAAFLRRPGNRPEDGALPETGDHPGVRLQGH